MCPWLGPPTVDPALLAGGQASAKENGRKHLRNQVASHDHVPPLAQHAVRVPGDHDLMQGVHDLPSIPGCLTRPQLSTNQHNSLPACFAVDACRCCDL